MTKGTSGCVAGIYIGNGASDVSSATGVYVIDESGKNTNILITGNTVQNVHAGICIRGSSVINFSDRDVIVGQNGAGNTILNFGGGNATTSYGIFFMYVANPTASNNTINNTGSGGSPHGSTLYGIYYSNGVSGTVDGNNNTLNLSVNASSAIYFISSSNTATSESFSNNTFEAGSFTSTSTSYLISASNGSAFKTISGNAVVAKITKTGASGAFYCYYNGASSAGSTETITGNDFSNITLKGNSTFNGIISTGSSSPQTRVCSGNTLSNITTGTGAVYLIKTTNTMPNLITNNTLQSITAGGTVYGLYFSGINATVYNNRVRDIVTTGAAIYGIFNAGTETTNCYKNKICNLTVNNSTPSLYGLYIQTGTSNNNYNNFISDLKTPVATSEMALAGIFVGGGTRVGVYYNTVFLNSTSTGAQFGSAALYTSTIPTLDVRNNILVNISVPNGSGVTAAFRRNGTSLENYSAASDGNCYYAGSAGTPMNAAFYDGITSYSLASFKALVGPDRDASSFSELPPFEETIPSCPDLHIQTAVGTSCESGGSAVLTPIVISDDFDGNARSALPDVGASEFSGTRLARWLGIKDSDYHNKENWAGGIYPLPADDVIIPDGCTFYPVLDAGELIQCHRMEIGSEEKSFLAPGLVISSGIAVDKDFTIKPNAMVHVNDGGRVTINGSLTILGNLTMESGSSLITNGTVSGNAAIKRTFDSNRNWHLISSPVLNQPICNGIFAPELSGFPGNPDSWDFYTWMPDHSVLPGSVMPWRNLRTPAGAVNFDDFGTPPEFEPTRGYLVAYGPGLNSEKLFTGNPNTGDKIFSFTDIIQECSWELAGNPFPSSVDWGLIPDKSQLLSNYYYVWNEHKQGGAGYEFWASPELNSNPSSGAVVIDGKIPPMQGFFIKINPNGTKTLLVPNTARVHSDLAHTWLKDGPANRLTIRLSNGVNFDEAFVISQNTSNFGKDSQDAEKMFSINREIPQVYTMVEKDQKTALNAMPSFPDGTKIPIGIVAPVEGNYSISITGEESLEPVMILSLEDLKLNITQNLLVNPVYSFTATGKEECCRFLLHFSRPDGVNQNANNLIKIHVNEKTIFITCMAGLQGGLVTVSNLLGQEILSRRLADQVSNKVRVNVPQGYYIVKVSSENSVKTAKAFIN